MPDIDQSLKFMLVHTYKHSKIREILFLLPFSVSIICLHRTASVEWDFLMFIESLMPLQVQRTLTCGYLQVRLYTD